MATALERLTRFYQKYNPDKLHEVDGVLERYQGKETQLFAALVKKYGPEPSSDETFSPKAASKPAPKQQEKKPVAQSKVVTDFNHARLVAFYQKYNPDKVGDVENVLRKYKGKEAQLFDALVRKYGPEPGDSDDEDDDEEPTQQAAAKQQEEAEEDEEDDDEEEEDGGEPRLKQVLYCPIDTLPPEYCEYGPMFNECKAWLGEHCPQLFLQKYNRTVEDFLEAERQIAEGVEGVTLEAEGKTAKKKKKAKKDDGKKAEDVMITISKSSRKGRKHVTFITGLDEIQDLNLKDAAKKLGKKFACSSTIAKTDTGKQQIQLQGDCTVELMDVLPEMFGVSEDQIVIVDDGKKKK